MFMLYVRVVDLRVIHRRFHIAMPYHLAYQLQWHPIAQGRADCCVSEYVRRYLNPRLRVCPVGYVSHDLLYRMAL